MAAIVMVMSMISKSSCNNNGMTALEPMIMVTMTMGTIGKKLMTLIMVMVVMKVVVPACMALE